MCKHNYRVLALFDLCLLLAFFSCAVIAQDTHTEDTLSILTWNVRGYPEKEQAARNWFSEQLLLINPQIVCIQEIANTDSISIFHKNEQQFTKSAFLDSGDGQDNAIFAADAIKVKDFPDPEGFQHPAQAAFVSYKGFDAVIVTVHLSWTNIDLREKEQRLLAGIVSEMLKTDPDVIITGDFNTKEDGIQELADNIGMKVMVPIDQMGVGTTHAGNRYDHFLISPDLANEEAMGSRILTYPDEDLELAKKVSDHLPVLACFRSDYKYSDYFSEDKSKILTPKTKDSLAESAGNQTSGFKADTLKKLFLFSSLPGAIGGMVLFLYGLQKRKYRNKFIRKACLDIVGGMLVASVVAPAIFFLMGDSYKQKCILSLFSFVIGTSWTGFMQVLRNKITRIIEAILGENFGVKE